MIFPLLSTYFKGRHHNDPRECCIELLKDWLTTENGAKSKIWSIPLDKLTEFAATEEIIKELSQI